MSDLKQFDGPLIVPDYDRIQGMIRKINEELALGGDTSFTRDREPLLREALEALKLARRLIVVWFDNDEDEISNLIERLNLNNWSPKVAHQLALLHVPSYERAWKEDHV